MIKLMQPKHVKTNEGKTIYFPFLYDKQMEEKEDGEINDTNDDEIGPLDWMKKEAQS